MSAASKHFHGWSPGAGSIGFGPFVFNLRARELRRRSIRVRVGQQPLQILEMLIEQPGEVVLRGEIRDRLWPDGTLVDFEHSINAAIQKLRQALDDCGDEPIYIETLKGRGYRFLQPVQLLDDQKIAAIRPVPDSVRQPVPIPRLAEVARRWPTSSQVWAAIALLLIFAAIILGLQMSRSAETRNWTLQLGEIEMPVVSPDGKAVLYAGSQHLTIRKLDSKVEVPLMNEPAERRIDVPAWSPDGSQIVVPTTEAFFKMQVPQGPPVRSGSVGPTRGLSWGDNGIILFAGVQAGVSRLFALSSSGYAEPTPVNIASLTSGKFYQPDFLPGAVKFLFVRGKLEVHSV